MTPLQTPQTANQSRQREVAEKVLAKNVPVLTPIQRQRLRISATEGKYIKLHANRLQFGIAPYEGTTTQPHPYLRNHTSLAVNTLRPFCQQQSKRQKRGMFLNTTEEHQRSTAIIRQFCYEGETVLNKQHLFNCLRFRVVHNERNGSIANEIQ